MTRILDFFRRTDGSSTIEVVILFPAFLIVLLASVESGIMMIRNVLLERGVDIAVRELRLGTSVPATEADLINLICEGAAFINDCDTVLRLEMVRVDMATFSMPTTSSTCVQRDELTQPVLEYTAGSDHELMLLRVCASFNPYFPTTGLGLRLPKDATGHYSLTAASAFVVEPG